jgi:hypothetical protein
MWMRSGKVISHLYTGVTMRTMTVRDFVSGRLIQDLPAGFACEAGDTVRVTLEVIKRGSKKS